MELDGIKRVVYWGSFFLLIFILAVFRTADRLSVTYRVILIVLLAFLSAKFRLASRYSFLSILLVVVGGIFAGVLLASNSAQMWAFAFIYVILFFLSCEVFEKGLLGV